MYIFTLTPRGSYLTLSPSIRLAWANSEIIARNEKTRNCKNSKTRPNDLYFSFFEFAWTLLPHAYCGVRPWTLARVYQLDVVRAWV